MIWLKNKRACQALFVALQNTGQIERMTEFSEVGKMRMKDLVFFKSYNNVNLREADATVLAMKFDSLFIKSHNAFFKNETNSIIRIGKMTDLMLEGNKTIEDLAEEVENCYEFGD